MTAIKLVVVGIVGSALAGCAGVYAGYGPGMTNEQRSSETCVPNAPGSSMGTCSTREYESGKIEYGVQLGARLGAASASAGEQASGTAFAVDAHADIVVAAEKWGVGVSGGYTSDNLFGEGNGFSFLGFPIAAYGQFGLGRKLFVHAGLGRVIYGSIKNTENGMSTDAGAWRGFGGLTYVFARNSRRDLALRIEARVQKSGDATLEGNDVTWSSAGVLAEIVYATF